MINKDPRFEKIDAECEKYIEKIEEAYVNFETHRAGIDKSDKTNPYVLSLFKDVFQNYTQILLIRKGLSKEDLSDLSPSKELKLEVLSSQMDVFCTKQDMIKEIFFSFNRKTGNKKKYPFFIYLDCALRNHLKGSIKKAVIQDVKSGIVISNSKTTLLTKVFRFIDSYYSYMDYDNIPDSVFEDFLKKENANRTNKLTLGSLKNAYMSFRSKAISKDTTAENITNIPYYDGDETDELILFEEQSSEIKFSKNKEEISKEELSVFAEEEYYDYQDQCDSSCSDYDPEYPDDYDTADEETNDDEQENKPNTSPYDKPVIIFQKLRNKDLILLFENCESEFRKIKKPQHRKFVSYMLTAEFIKNCIDSCNGRNREESVLLNKDTIDSFINILRDFSFFAEEVVELFKKKQKALTEQDVADMLNTPKNTVTYHFLKFKRNVGLPITKNENSK